MINISGPNPFYILKIIIAGDSGVGKTTLINRFVDGRFLPAKKATIGVYNFLKNVKMTIPTYESTISL